MQELGLKPLNNEEAKHLEIQSQKVQEAFENVAKSKEKLTSTIGSDAQKYIVSEKKLGGGGKGMIN